MDLSLALIGQGDYRLQGELEESVISIAKWEKMDTKSMAKKLSKLDKYWLYKNSF